MCLPGPAWHREQMPRSNAARISKMLLQRLPIVTGVMPLSRDPNHPSTIGRVGWQLHHIGLHGAKFGRRFPKCQQSSLSRLKFGAEFAWHPTCRNSGLEILNCLREVLESHRLASSNYGNAASHRSASHLQGLKDILLRLDLDHPVVILVRVKKGGQSFNGGGHLCRGPV